ncbi:kojibiose phosphorylase [Angomonas deanei]|uniref:Glycosyl hydrolase family 65 central catalytic domain/Glycosyl hydrolase family 65, C-terminal domain/Haloacid dehalogenase-like hydrolase, putative n=1 Tax=Angomonas deanei TaxID=59799 RepID=A0A7G2C5W3_9TRYP|nr:kojibiose phosphorylase [Angomonas deanei]CAD2214989.1 Glycosyl hydrolase family 65 central catalytic domain/Glycosyl hydrolase family 65, C-terminal domain/Haloacid dehalogenase-like hydrolase, putative [Angomonas deanei]|eukprot:EPY36547.1 kojibiose phosphorylase [Angomonas deanei]
MVSIIEEKQRHLAPFWENFNVDLQLQDELTPNRTRLSLLYNAFRLFEVSQNLENGLAASGYSVSGDGLLYRLCDYIYFCLYYIATAPDCALQLIKSLHKMLAVCRKNAEDLCLPGGAVFPMVTIKGTNCRSYSNYNNTRLPINAYIGKMIAAFFAAVEAVSEEDRLLLMELMLETARVWLSMGEWVEGRTYFRLENIAGADEYNSSVSGNFFIHLSAKDHLNRAVDLLAANEKLLGTEKIDALLEKINMTREELEEMKEASKAIVVRKSDRLGIYMVHDYFDKLATWKGGAQHPLSSNYHPLAIYRHKVVDLPEVLMGLLLHDTLFEPTDFEQNYNYYLPLCTFDSPESMGIFAISQCRARGEFAQPIPFLKSLANLDLDDIIYSADEGLHFGSMALSLNTLIYGLGGVSFADGQLFVSPILPAGVASLRFSVCFRGCVLSVVLNEKELVYELKSGDSLRFIHGQQRLRVHLHTKYRRFEALSKMVIPRASFSLVSQFDGAVFLADSLFLNLYEYNYVSWYRVLETLFDTYRALQNKTIAPLSPHEFIQKVVYQTESSEIAFSGIHNILLSRGIDLELGTPDDAEIVETRYGLANAKLAEMTEMLEKDPPQINPELYHLLQSLETNKISMAIVTYSRSLKQLMSSDAHNLSRYFITHIDGEEAHDRHIKSRPHVDLYLRAAEKLHVVPERCLVFAHHLDRDYAAEEMARFRMFLDIEDPFVSSREELSAYPTLSEEYCEKHNRDNPVVCRLLLNKMPSTVNHLEDVVDGL